MKLYIYPYKFGYKVYRLEDNKNKTLLGYLDFKDYFDGWQFQNFDPDLVQRLKGKFKDEASSVIYANQCIEDVKHFEIMYKAYYANNIDFMYFRPTDNERITKSITEEELEHINLLLIHVMNYFVLRNIDCDDLVKALRLTQTELEEPQRYAEFQKRCTETCEKLLSLGYTNLIKRQSELYQ